LSYVSVLHVTDGAPHDWGELQSAGFKTASNYARVRREECLAALKLAHISREHVLDLRLSDQEASRNLVELVKKILGFLLQSSPDIVLTHSYEGGHPDHDATAFAMHMAVELMKQRGIKPPIVFEMALHPSKNWKLKVLEFLPNMGRETTTFVLDNKRRELKRRMYKCFRTQREVLEESPLGPEKFRRSLGYDFAQPPRFGKPHYESFRCGMTSKRWQALACRAINELFPAEHRSVGSSTSKLIPKITGKLKLVQRTGKANSPHSGLSPVRNRDR
jgi:LmbE family N-acetylglucosaminyl deacetylase